MVNFKVQVTNLNLPRTNLNLPRRTRLGFNVLGNYLGAEDGAKTVAIVDIIIIEVRAGIIAGYPRIIVVVLLRKPLSGYFPSSKAITN
jgi:hypothetical protein